MQINLIGQKEIFERKKADYESQAQEQDIRSIAHVREKGLPKQKITCPFGVDEKIDHRHQQADSRDLKGHADYGNTQYDPEAFSADRAQNLVRKKKRFHVMTIELFSIGTITASESNPSMRSSPSVLFQDLFGIRNLAQI